MKDINPDNFSENIRARDWIWLKKNMAKLMSMTGNIADKYSRSGNYDAECEYLEWGKFCVGSASWVYYSVLVFPAIVMKDWLPQLPPDNVRDTDILGDKKKKKKNDNTIKDRMKRYTSRNSDADSDRSSETKSDDSYAMSSSFSAIGASAVQTSKRYITRW